jgi:class 3 adenylate cyclase
VGRCSDRARNGGGMTHQTNLATIKGYLNESYERQTTSTVPKRSDLTFGNTLKTMDHAVVFYVDMRSSRKVIQDTTEFVSAKAHKAFLQAVVYCVENRDGHFRSFNGDGALAFFRGANAASRAVRAALDLKAYVMQINGVLTRQGTGIDFGVGIGQGKVHVVKSGKRGDDQTKQDLVWIGLPVYVAVELSDFGSTPNNIWISPYVRESIGKQNHLNVVNHNGKSMWTRVTKELKSVGTYEPRYTTFFSTLFS